MSVVRTGKHAPVCIGVAAALIALVGLAGCGQNSASQGKAEVSEPPPAVESSSAPLPATASADAPETSNATGPAPIAASAPATPQSVPLQTAQAATPATVQADEPVGAATSAGDIPDHTPATTLSAEQQELAAEVGDTRHASADSAGSDKTPDQP